VYFCRLHVIIVSSSNSITICNLLMVTAGSLKASQCTDADILLSAKCTVIFFSQCFDTVGRASGRPSRLFSSPESSLKTP